MEGRVVKSWAVDRLVDALEVVVHAVLYRVGAYPKSSFRQHARFDSLFWMCDIEEVHDYVAVITETLRKPLLANLVEALNILIFSQEELRSCVQVEIPGDICRDVFRKMSVDRHTEFEVANMMNPWLRKLVTSVYCCTDLIRDWPDVSWRVTVDTKISEGDDKEDILVENVLEMPQELIDELRSLPTARRPLCSFSLFPTETATICCSIDRF